MRKRSAGSPPRQDDGRPVATDGWNAGQGAGGASARELEFAQHSAGAGAPEGSQAPKFDRELWRRFCLIVKVYFYRDGSVAGLGRCMVGMLLGTIGGAFWILYCGVELTMALAPPRHLPEGLPDLSTQLNTEPYPVIAFVAMTIAGAVAFAERKRLRGLWQRWAILALLLAFLFMVSGLNVTLSYVFRALDNNLHEKNEDGFYAVMFRYGMVLVVAVPVLGAYSYMRSMLGRNWRAALTEYFLAGYLADRVYYKLDSNSKDADIDNPDQRIAEDINSFTGEALDIIIELLNSMSNLFSFSAILWFTSQRLFGSLVTYAFVGTLFSLYFGQKLMVLLYQQLRCEADFRYSLVRIRDNAEAIAFYAGEGLEKAGALDRFSAVLDNFTQLMIWSTLSGMYKNTFFYLARLVPYLVIGGLYFSGKVDFGTLSQGTLAFSMVLESVTVIITEIKTFSKFTASINRLGAFHDAINGVTSTPLGAPAAAADAGRAPAARGSQVQLTDVVGRAGDEEEVNVLLGAASTSPHGAEGLIHTRETPGGGVDLAGVTVETPTCRILVENLSLSLTPTGESLPPAGSVATTALRAPRLLVVGPSGIGKSSLLRVIAGLWNRGSGHVRRPPTSEMFFLPQKPYMPLGNLRTQLLYPNLSAAVTDEELSATLCHLGLSDLHARFPKGYDEVQDWARVLSGGEQQRLAAARCLLAVPAPALVVLDEATSAMPVNDESVLYGLLGKRGLSYISVGHRETLLAHHDLVLQIKDGGWKLLEPAEYRQLIER